MIGIIVNVISVAVGGVCGTLFGHKMSQAFTEKLTCVFGVCAMGMGISSIVLMENMPAVILAIVVGTALGLALHVGDWIVQGASLLQKPIARVLGQGAVGMSQDEFLSLLVTAIVLFCASGTGIYGSLDAGMTGEATILLSKSVLDFFTAIVFACSLGAVVSVVAVPQAVIFLALLLMAKVIFPLTTPVMIADFKACGGFLLIATGLRMAKIRDFPIADMIPAMVLVMPVSGVWVRFLAPLF